MPLALPVANIDNSPPLQVVWHRIFACFFESSTEIPLIFHQEKGKATVPFSINSMVNCHQQNIQGNPLNSSLLSGPNGLGNKSAFTTNHQPPWTKDMNHSMIAIYSCLTFHFHLPSQTLRRRIPSHLLSNSSPSLSDFIQIVAPCGDHFGGDDRLLHSVLSIPNEEQKGTGTQKDQTEEI